MQIFIRSKENDILSNNNFIKYDWNNSMPFIGLSLIVLFIILILILLFWKIIFLRNPSRSTPNSDNSIFSPADGKIIEILEFKGPHMNLHKGTKRFLGLIQTLTKDVAESGYIVSIFMSPLDVHYNRAPISGKVTKITHSNGKFLPVNTFEAGLVNEKAEIIISNNKITLKMIQIAGFIARRVITHVKKGDNVKAGEIVGLINLGSQVTLILPKSVIINVSKGDRVVAGETILAKINS
jgi:phosphatidylserine decarboxylase